MISFWLWPVLLATLVMVISVAIWCFAVAMYLLMIALATISDMLADHRKRKERV